MRNSISLLVLVLTAAGGFLYFKKDGVPIIISESQINAALRQDFPVTQTYLQVIELTYSNPRVTLKPTSDRVQLELDPKLSIKLLPGAKNLTGSLLVDSEIRYQAATRQFFLADPAIRKFEIAGMPRDYVDKVTQVAVELLKSKLEQEPIYTVEGPEAAMLATNILVKDVRVKGGAVQVLLGL